jgi:hypothetical protein
VGVWFSAYLFSFKNASLKEVPYIKEGIIIIIATTITTTITIIIKCFFCASERVCITHQNKIVHKTCCLV